MPYNSLGSPAVLDAANKGITIFAIKENSTALNVTAEKLGIQSKVNIIETYDECLGQIINI